VERVPLSKIRQTIARRLSESWTAAPHIFVTMAIDMGAALALREQVNEALAASGGGKVSVNDLVLKAVGVSLRREPRMNASWDDGARIQHPRTHVGVAVALDDGLITLTIPDADVQPLSRIAALSAGMSERARAGKLQPEDVATPSTFTVSNLGMYGVTEFTAILNPPEAGILAVGAALPTPVVRDGEVVVRPMMNVTLSADHRVVDGATAAQFLVQLKQALENPLVMLV
jgi:pyruvate dehydrogenase E2 component (dihydrolipoamide acetyltransferase)